VKHSTNYKLNLTSGSHSMTMYTEMTYSSHWFLLHEKQALLLLNNNGNLAVFAKRSSVTLQNCSLSILVRPQ